MKILNVLVLFLLFNSIIFADEFSINYQLIDRTEFEKLIVGNTVVGITRQSSSLYMLYFLSNGSCELWKQDKIYAGKWWFESDSEGRDLVRAFWPKYTSADPQSFFSPNNPHFGKATAVRYYRNMQNGALYIAGKKFANAVILVP